MSAEIRLVPCLQDNYAVILRDAASGAVVVIDAPDAASIEQALDDAGWRATHILITHKHQDHVAGVPRLKERFGAEVIAPAEAREVDGVDRVVGEGDSVAAGGLSARVIDTPGHTAGHVSYWFPEEAALFAGDTLFVMGCGRVGESAPATLWASLRKLRDLPPETRVWCGHEYTLANARFAVTVDPGNEALRLRLAEVEALRGKGEPTVPTTIANERATNPFLRADAPEVAAAVGLAGRDPAEVFAEVRERKNRF